LPNAKRRLRLTGGKVVSTGANAISTTLSAIDIANGNAQTITYVDFGVGLTGIVTSAAGYFSGVEIPVVGEFVALYGITRTTWDVFFFLGYNYGPSHWYGTDDTKWFK